MDAGPKLDGGTRLARIGPATVFIPSMIAYACRKGPSDMSKI
jgi:hypothetical protein